ncbi:uncharacterized protein MYCFIDRAFT_183144 [Pseudocercospora fijiensis CIRAD86]|uniref:Uncharacterized protein n=1 Tax=Pseudocercospora fijiensis (strain CIRAD86) TaxID=383855 RepID=M3A863_PSEFD|nr:uncharacterized protein MYCFIDRAFT_183144 [Pseudocercospora fijiensis CIRAD86]EME80786.1 hypothetical protein MYCFIDRAFT_183144 [Pseudocercospora fijiensis CIRAD86]
MEALGDTIHPRASATIVTRALLCILPIFVTVTPSLPIPNSPRKTHSLDLVSRHRGIVPHASAPQGPCSLDRFETSTSPAYALRALTSGHDTAKSSNIRPVLPIIRVEALRPKHSGQSSSARLSLRHEWGNFHALAVTLNVEWELSYVYPLERRDMLRIRFDLIHHCIAVREFEFLHMRKFPVRFSPIF